MTKRQRLQVEFAAAQDKYLDLHMCLRLAASELEPDPIKIAKAAAAAMEANQRMHDLAWDVICERFDELEAPIPDAHVEWANGVIRELAADAIARWAASVEQPDGTTPTLKPVPPAVAEAVVDLLDSVPLPPPTPPTPPPLTRDYIMAMLGPTPGRDA